MKSKHCLRLGSKLTFTKGDRYRFSHSHTRSLTLPPSFTERERVRVFFWGGGYLDYPFNYAQCSSSGQSVSDPAKNLRHTLAEEASRKER